MVCILVQQMFDLSYFTKSSFFGHSKKEQLPIYYKPSLSRELSDSSDQGDTDGFIITPPTFFCS